MRLQLRHCPECRDSTEQARVEVEDVWRCRRCECEIKDYRVVKLGPELAHQRGVQTFAEKPETSDVV